MTINQMNIHITKYHNKIMIMVYYNSKFDWSKNKMNQLKNNLILWRLLLAF